MFVIKLFITFVIFYVISQNINLSEVLVILKSANIWYLVLAIFLQFLTIIVASIRWSLLMKNLSFNHKLRFYIKHYFIGILFSQAMPSSIGGDAYRVITLSKQGHTKLNSFYGVLIDRIMGFLGLIIVIFFGLIISKSILPTDLFQGIIILLTFSFLAVFGVFIFRKLPLPKHKTINWLTELSIQFQKTLNRFDKWYPQILLSILIYIFAIATMYFIALSVGLEQPFYLFVLFVPISLLLTMIPISFAGWGLRETGMVVMFSLVGVPKETILIVSILFGLSLIIVSLPSGYLFLKNKL